MLSSIRHARNFDIRLKNMLFSVSTDEYGIFKEIFIDGEYSSALSETQCFHPDFVLDLGGNVGFSVIYFRHRFPTVPIYVFEPLPPHFDRLKQNLRTVNGVTLCQNSAGCESRRVNFFDYGAGSSSVIDHSCVQAKRYECNELDIFEFVNELEHVGRGLLKVDIEGGEWELFGDARMSNLLQRFGSVILEVHQFDANSISAFEVKYLGPLRSQGWRIKVIRKIQNWASVYVMSR